MDLNLYSSHLGMLIMRANMNGMYFLVFYAFFEGLPDSYMEAAEIDGAGQFSIFTKIVIPLGIKMVLTVTLLLFVQNWNDYSINFIYMPTVPTMSYVLYKLVHDNAFFSQVADKTVPTKFAACFILVAPIIILFIIFKDKMMGNISAGGLKG